jgi:predicted acyltransferase (DUF342 family)
MKDKLIKSLLVIAVVVSIVTVVFAATNEAGEFAKVLRENHVFLNDVDVDGNVDIDGTLGAAGAVTLSGAVSATNGTFSSNLSYGGSELSASDSVSLTSPTTTVDVSGKRVVIVTSDAAQTGITFTNATAGQTFTILGTSDSNTIRVDDNGTTMALGANITLGADDALTMYAKTASTFARVSSADN